MANYEAIIESNLPPTDEDYWQFVRFGGKFPERYVERLDRRMAEALWAMARQKYPNMTIGVGSNKRPMPLYHAAAAYTKDYFAVGLSKEVIEQGRVCAALTRTAIEIVLSHIDEIDLEPNLD
jgi:hypothetical protein